jgi:hypothetical protein
MTRSIFRMAALVAVLGLPGAPARAEMNPRFVPLKALLGKTWRGEFPTAAGAKPVVDVSRFELVLNGQAVRNLHSINQGEYGGESLVVWDKDKQSLVYYYFTTAGFYTTGTMSAEDGAVVSHEVVKGDAEGITEVKGTSRLLPDGRLHVQTQYLKNGSWVPGRDVYYVEDAGATVRFKE